MFTIQLRRRKALSLDAWVQTAHQHEFVGPFEKIGLITPELLQVLPCNKPQDVQTGPGIPFDLPALLFLLTNEQHRSGILKHITEDATASEVDPLFIFCPGSSINGNLACVQITCLSPMKLEITDVDYNDQRQWNARQLRYAA